MSSKVTETIKLLFDSLLLKTAMSQLSILTKIQPVIEYITFLE